MLPLILLKESLVNALKENENVVKIAFFGSLAKETFDSYSDIDIIVALSNPINGLYSLQNFGTIVFYRPFTTTKYPSGRYWVKDYSIFNKIDISFHSITEFDHLLKNGEPETFKTPPFQLEWERNCAHNSDILNSEKELYSPFNSSEEEQLIGQLAYKLSLLLKDYYRNKSSQYNFNELWPKLIELWKRHKNRKWIGGDLDILVESVVSHVELMQNEKNKASNNQMEQAGQSTGSSSGSYTSPS